MWVRGSGGGARGRKRGRQTGESGSPLKHSGITDTRAIERKTQTGQRQTLPPSLVHPPTPPPPLKRRRVKKQQHTAPAGECRAGLNGATVLLGNGCSLLQKGGGSCASASELFKWAGSARAHFTGDLWKAGRRRDGVTLLPQRAHTHTHTRRRPLFHNRGNYLPSLYFISSFLLLR